MSQAIQRALDHLRQRGWHEPVDALGLSLSCEFLTLAAHAQPAGFRSLAFVSPTGLESDRDELYRNGRSKDLPPLRRLLASPLGEPVFRALTRPAVMRRFMERTWGSPAIEEGLLDYSARNARQPGARHAPAAFIAGALFTEGIADRYARLPQPVWLAHGVRGEFSDFGGLGRLNLASRWTTDAFGAGAMPHFEVTRRFMARYEAFLGALRSPLRCSVCQETVA